MPIGFIPQDETQGRDDLDMYSERWHASQFVEAMTLNKMIQDACEALFNRVRKYADQLEYLDPLQQDAELAVGNVVLALSHNECAQERLETLLNEVRRLNRVVAEARCGLSLSKGAELPPGSRRLPITGQDVFLVLLWGICLLCFILVA